MTRADVNKGGGGLEDKGEGSEEREVGGGGEEGGKRSNLAALASALVARRVASRVLASPIILTQGGPTTAGCIVKARCQVMQWNISVEGFGIRRRGAWGALRGVGGRSGRRGFRLRR